MRSRTLSAHLSPGAALAAALLTGCPDYNVARIPSGDSYLQGGPERPVDVLWVIDDSATMTEEQEALLTNFQAYADVLNQTGVDFQIGIITTDVEEDAGVIVGEVLTADTEDLDAAFTEAADVGVTGSREEQHLEAIRLATSSAALSDGNDALFRDDADLQIVILTDEDDQSEGEVSAYIDHLSTFKEATSFRVSLIGGPLPSGCASSTSSAEAATRLLSAVESTGGVFKSICEADFGPVMKSIAFNSMGMTDTFELTEMPDLSSLEVKVDGVHLHQRPSDGWQYDAGENAVVLDGLAVPRPGQTVDVLYYEIFSSAASGGE